MRHLPLLTSALLLATAAIVWRALLPAHLGAAVQAIAHTKPEFATTERLPVSLLDAERLAFTRVSDTARVDTAATEIRWKRTKFGGRGAHSGILRVRSG